MSEWNQHRQKLMISNKKAASPTTPIQFYKKKQGDALQDLHSALFYITAAFAVF